MSFPSHDCQVARSPAGTGLPRRAGVGFKCPHFDELVADPDPPGFVEVHAENHMGAGGVPHAQLTRIRESLPVSLHGVGRSIGGADAPDPGHPGRLGSLIESYQPVAFSEHLAWSTRGGAFLNGLLPLSYDAPTLQRARDHIDRIQERLGLRMLLENPSASFELEARRRDCDGLPA
jgi:uncharacterized protein (UPF0276 family)